MESMLLRPEEAAEWLNIGRSKVYELLRVGVIESVQIGACRRIPRTALVEYVDSLRQTEAS
jgi:excisionase family DNA binding protein